MLSQLLSPTRDLRTVVNAPCNNREVAGCPISHRAPREGARQTDPINRESFQDGGEITCEITVT